jgi:hypothetical protein
MDPALSRSRRSLPSLPSLAEPSEFWCQLGVKGLYDDFRVSGIHTGSVSGDELRTPIAFGNRSAAIEQRFDHR